MCTALFRDVDAHSDDVADLTTRIEDATGGAVNIDFGTAFVDPDVFVADEALFDDEGFEPIDGLLAKVWAAKDVKEWLSDHFRSSVSGGCFAGLIYP